MKHRKSTAWITALAVCILFAQALQAQVQTPKHITINGNVDGFYEYLPEGYNWGNQTYPLIVFIHGIGELGNGHDQLPMVLNHGIPKLINNGQFPQAFNVNGQSHRFIVISPQFKQWPSPYDINAVIDYAIQHYRVNTSRVYVTGLSMGGGATWEYAGEPGFASRVAAIVPVCGASWPAPSRAQVIANNQVAVWATHNEGDWTVPVWYTNDYIAYINSNNPNPAGKKSIWQNNSHDAWSQTYDPNYRENGLNIYEWMLQYVRGSVPNQPPTVTGCAAQTITLPANAATISGTASDADGTITSYQWTKVSGPNAIINTPNAATTQVSGLTEGTYIFKLTVTDNLGASAFANVYVTVNPAPQLTPSGRIEAENWITMSGVQTEWTWDEGGGRNVGWIDNGDWMEYGFDAPSAGVYSLKLRIATPNNGAQLQVRKTDGTILATVNLPNTGGFQAWHTVTTNITLGQGHQTFRLVSTANPGWNINWLEPVLATANTPPAAAVTRIEAENFASMSGIQTEHTWDEGGGLNVGWIDNGDWMNYTYNAPSSGTYTVRLRIASPNANGALQLRKDDGTVLATVPVPNTGGWQTWQTVTATINLSQGMQALRVVSTAANGWNFNWMELVAPGNTNTPPSGRIEAEHFTAQHGVQTENTWDEGGGLNVGWIDNGDWMEYSVNSTTAATQTIKLRIATPNNGAQLEIRKPDGSLLATVALPNTGGYQLWQTVSASINLPEGVQTIRLVSTSWVGWNINWLELNSSIITPPPASTLTRIEAENYLTMHGVQTENTWDAGGGQNVGWIDNGDWMEYNYTAPAPGSYRVKLRIATPNNGAQVQLKKSDGSVLTTVDLPNTGGYQVWQTITTQVYLSQGQQVLRLQSTAWQGWNINWLEIEGPLSDGAKHGEEDKDAAGQLQLYPNPITHDNVVLTANNPYSGSMRVVVTDFTGVPKKQFLFYKANAGVSQHHLSLADLPAGTYVIRVIMDEWSKGITVVK